MAFVNAGGIASLTKSALDAQVLGIINTVMGGLEQAVEMNTFLAANVDANFTAAPGGPGPTGYAAGDVTIMKSAFARLKALSDIANGTVAQGATPENFFVFPLELVTGIR